MRKKDACTEVDKVMCVQERNVTVWEKRLTLIVMTLLIGYIANVAGDMRSRLEVIETNLNNTGAIIEKHDGMLMRHEQDLRRQDNRITRVESQIRHIGP